ncbi:hypothetical protein EV179_005030 [Coemansia sp. RSA 487]|nr:hypothetical protein EV179_005030 [Coemansia sp. RSA 487]
MPSEETFGFVAGLHQSAMNDAEANPTNDAQRPVQLSSELDSIHDPSVLGRVVEMESVIATVKSSLDNHASSYYSVASQIADANAVFATDALETTAPSAIATANTDGIDGSSVLMPEEQSDRENSDAHYTRIQQMIDSLIKDADSALQSRPATNRFSICSDDSVDIPGKVPAFFTEQFSSMPADFGETPTLISDAEPCIQDPPAFSFTHQHAPCSLPGLEYHRPATPRQKQQLHIRSYSPLPKHRTIVDPTEADAESDSEVSLSSVLGPRHRRRNHNNKNNNSSHSQRPYSSRSRRRGVPSYYRDRQTMGSRASRRRSNTLESIFSNSSETCVSPVSRSSKEFRNTPAPYYIRNSPFSASVGETFHSFEKDMLIAPEDHVHSTEQCVFSTPTTSKNTHEFPRLSFDGHRQENSGDARPACTERRLSSPLLRRVPPLINRFRNTVTRAALRSASFVDDSVNDDIAAFESGGSAQDEHLSDYHQQQTRTRSNTYGGEFLPAMFSQPAEHPRYSRAASSSVYSVTDVRNHSSSDTEQRKCSGSFIKGNSPLGPTAATKYVVSKLQGNSSSDAAGILSIFSLVYWTLLFTLGALMLDSFLCQVAGKRVMGAVDRIAQTESASVLDHSGRRKGTGSSGRQRGKERADDAGDDTINATSAMGRLVRWYIEDPDDTPGARARRLRNIQTARGLFKRVD